MVAFEISRFRVERLEEKKKNGGKALTQHYPTHTHTHTHTKTHVKYITYIITFKIYKPYIHTYLGMHGIVLDQTSDHIIVLAINQA